VIRAVARCRVDLAGGTLDIWPLGAMHPGSVTVNLAIELPVEVRLTSGGSEFIVRQDGATQRSPDARGLLADPSTALAGLVALELELPPVTLELASASPRGAGLGASSALTVALLAAAETLREGGLSSSPEQRAAVARDLEARLMGLPTGLQDHLPGQLGGVLAIEHRAGGERIRRLRADLESLGERLVVAYTGQSHFSAGNNWSILRRRFEGDADTVARLDRIRDVARELPAAIEAGEWEAIGGLLNEEWNARRGLAPEVTTPELDRLLAACRELGAWGGKACGAGGGGSIALLVPPERRPVIETALVAAGAQLLAAPPTARGLEVTSGRP
jgi:D-glycero-alpha-D-manno-heptose-7-phosphate kinase